MMVQANEERVWKDICYPSKRFLRGESLPDLLAAGDEKEAAWLWTSKSELIFAASEGNFFERLVCLACRACSHFIDHA